jgi:hypothetical protein
MDANKKYLYFNTDSGDQDNARSFPVSSLVAIDIENNNTTQIKLLFKEAVQTDTTDIKLSRTTNSKDPRDFMEHLINEINFGKDATIVVADDSVGQYIHPDIDGVDNISEATYSSPLIKLGSDIHVFRQQASDPGDGFSASNYTFNTGTIGTINGEVLTTLFIDLNANTIVSSSDAGDVIGKDDAANAYFTQVTTIKNGIVYAGEIICVEVPTTGDADINVAANTSGTIAEDAAGEGQHVLANCGTQTVGLRTPFTIPSGGIQNDFLYLTHGGSTAGAYGAGKFIVRLFGAPSVNLNDIS